ncbi:MAG: hypothetical protein ACKVTZ_21430 [Bacteroidia bacterium]
MKKILFWNGLLTIALLSAACGSQNEFGGTENLKDASLSWIPFAGNEQVVFKNVNGDSLVFKGGTKSLKYAREITGCDGGTWNSGGCIENDLQQQSISFQCTDPKLALNYLLAVKKTNETRWDILTVSLLENNTKKTTFSFDVTQVGIPNSHESFFYGDSVKIAGKNFAEVFRNKTTGSYNVYYNKSQGVVGFELGDGSQWAK